MEDVKPEPLDDPSLADWFKVDKVSPRAAEKGDASETESETEPESDNEDTREPEDEDGWLKVSSAGSELDPEVVDGVVSLFLVVLALSNDRGPCSRNWGRLICQR